jgi:hypothetical protein
MLFVSSPGTCFTVLARPIVYSFGFGTQTETQRSTMVRRRSPDTTLTRPASATPPAQEVSGLHWQASVEPHLLSFLHEGELEVAPQQYRALLLPGCFPCHDGNDVSKTQRSSAKTAIPAIPSWSSRKAVTRCLASDPAFQTSVGIGELQNVNCSDCQPGGVRS